MVDKSIMRMIVPGQPQGKGRARAFMRGSHIGHYTPEKTRSYEGVIATLAMEAMKGQPPSLLALSLDLVLGFEIPRSWPQWKARAAAMGDIAPTTKPDADNVVKAVKDALNGIAWRDDCQVVQVSVRKEYTNVPGVSVIVSFVDAVPAQTKRRA